MFIIIFILLVILMAIDSILSFYMLKQFKVREKYFFMRWLVKTFGYTGKAIVASVLKIGVLVLIYYFQELWSIFAVGLPTIYADIKNIKIYLLLRKLNKQSRGQASHIGRP